ncbi:MAG: hypothetical protein PUF95_03920 [Selenomonadaceae bacterium]|nr:hypothetical protein [Selenomonadaceae bacterium]
MSIHAIPLLLADILSFHDELENTIIAVADGSIGSDELARWLKEHTKI